MSTPGSAPAPTPPPPQPAAPAPIPPQRHGPPAVVWVAGIVILVALAFWWRQRENESITDDAFVEAHIVNVAPEAVSGRIVRFTKDENDRVEAGDVLAEIDPTPYLDQVAVAKAKLATAEAEWKRQELSLARLKTDVPLGVKTRVSGGWHHS